MRSARLCLALVLIVAVGLTLGPIAEARTLRISYNVAPGSSWDQGARRFKELVEERSGGRYTVELYPNAILAGGNDRVELEMTQAGAIDFLIKSTQWLTALDREFLLISLPWLFPNHEVANQVMDGPAGQRLLDGLERHNLVGLAWGVNGFRQVTNSKREIRRPEDLRGLKIRVPGNEMYLAIFQHLGAVPVTMSFAEVFTALQTGAVDGQENPLSLIWSSRFHDVQNYVTIWNYSYDAVAFIASGVLWRGLSEEDRAMFAQAAKEAMAYEREIVAQEDIDLVVKLAEEGITVTQLTDEEIEAFRQALAPVYRDYVNNIGPEVAKLFEDGVRQALN